MSWTDERVQLLSRLWLEGKSASQIATALGGGLTRNAVIGKVHRLGLAGRVKASAPPTAPEEEPETEVFAPVEAVADVAVGARRAAARPSAPAPSVSTSAIARAIQGNTALAMAEPAPETPQIARAPEEVVVPLSLKVTIVELRESMCKWPIGDPSSADFRYCGSPSHSGTPYCQHHGKLAYQPAQDRRRERDRRPMLAR